MEEKWLEDYEARETERIQEFFECQQDGLFDRSVQFPPDNRFPTFERPRHRAVQFSPDGALNPWPQLPFAGSLMIRLQAVPPASFKVHHGFDIGELPDVVEYAKESGRVQFVLSQPAPQYGGWDEYDVVFKELEPPRYKAGLRGNTEEFRRGAIEYDTIARIHYWDWWESVEPKLATYTGQAEAARWARGRRNWEQRVMGSLRALGLHRVVDTIQLEMTTNPARATSMLQYAGHLLIGPLMELSGSIHCYSAAQLAEAKQVLPRLEGLDTATFPHEIGSFLSGQLVDGAADLDAAKEIIDRYGEDDLYALFRTLDSYVHDCHERGVIATQEEINEVLEARWNMSERIATSGKFIEGGILLGVATAGYLVAGHQGLLSTIGLEVLDRMFDASSRAAGTVASGIANPVTTRIFDFRTKYPWLREEKA